MRLAADAAAELFPAAWLWASAPAHRDASTRQLSLSAMELSTPPALLSAEVVAAQSTLSLQWDNGSITLYPGAFLRAHSLSAPSLACDIAASAPTTLPQRKEDVETFAFDSLFPTAAAEEQQLALLRAINRSGVALVRGCPTEDPKAVERLAGSLAPVMRTIYGESWEVSVQEQPINVAYTSRELELHQDLVYYESPPGLQLLLCREFSEGVRGGESTFACALSAAEALRREDPLAFATLCRVPTTFQKVHYARATPAHIVTARPILSLGGGQWGGEGAVTAVFWAPPFEGPLRVPLADVEPYFHAYRAFAAILEGIGRGARPGLLQFRLAPGEAIVFNQRRVLHGRRAFFSQGRFRRVLQGCYIQADEWMSRLKSSQRGVPKEPLARTGNSQLW